MNRWLYEDPRNFLYVNVSGLGRPPQQQKQAYFIYPRAVMNQDSAIRGRDELSFEPVEAFQKGNRVLTPKFEWVSTGKIPLHIPSLNPNPS